MTGNRKAIVLLSGGVDSATTLAHAIRDGFEAYALSFHYGQRHAMELVAVRRIAALLGVVEHKIITLDLRAFGGSGLTDDLPIPKDRKPEEMEGHIPTTYVPARNTIFLAYALAWAEVLGTGDIFLGVNALDHGGYPDCRPEFMEAFCHLGNLATKAGVEGQVKLKVHTPLVRLTKAEIIRTGLTLGLDYAVTSSCYDPKPTGEACGRCDACILRRDGFAANGIRDPGEKDLLTQVAS